MVGSYSARSEPDEPQAVMHYCANCGHQLLRPEELLPEICPECHDLTTWLQHPPRHIRWRVLRKSQRESES